MDSTGEGMITAEATSADDEDRRARCDPQRRCIATRDVGAKAGLLRFAVGPEGSLLFDPAERLPGRGLWLTPRRDIVAATIAKGLFSKAAGRRLAVPDDLVGLIERQLRARCLALLGLARRAGQLRTGFEKVREDLRAGRVGLLLAARDGAADGRSKLAALAGGCPVIALFDSMELSAALGQEKVVHAAVSKGGMAQRLLREVGRLQGMQAAEDINPRERRNESE